MVTSQWLSNPNNAYYHTPSQLCVYALCMYTSTMVEAYWIIDLETLADGDGFQCSSS